MILPYMNITKNNMDLLALALILPDQMVHRELLVHLVLTGPKNREQLMINFRAVQQGILTTEELDWIRQYGKQIRSKKRFDYL